MQQRETPGHPPHSQPLAPTGFSSHPLSVPPNLHKCYPTINTRQSQSPPMPWRPPSPIAPQNLPAVHSIRTAPSKLKAPAQAEEGTKGHQAQLVFYYQAFSLMQSTWETLAAHPTASQPHPAPGAGDALDYLSTQSWGQQPRGFSSQHGVMLKGISSGTCCARGTFLPCPDTGRSHILQPCPCQKTSKITQGVLCCPDTFKFIEQQMQSPQLRAEIMQLGH